MGRTVRPTSLLSSPPAINSACFRTVSIADIGVGGVADGVRKQGKKSEKAA